MGNVYECLKDHLTHWLKSIAIRQPKGRGYLVVVLDGLTIELDPVGHLFESDPALPSRVLH